MSSLTLAIRRECEARKILHLDILMNFVEKNWSLLQSGRGQEKHFMTEIFKRERK